MCTLPEPVIESLSLAYPELSDKPPKIMETVYEGADLFKHQFQRIASLFKGMINIIKKRSDQMMIGKEAYLFLSKFEALIGLLTQNTDKYEVNVDLEDLERRIVRYDNSS